MYHFIARLQHNIKQILICIFGILVIIFTAVITYGNVYNSKFPFYILSNLPALCATLGILQLILICAHSIDERNKDQEIEEQGEVIEIKDHIIKDKNKKITDLLLRIDSLEERGFKLKEIIQGNINNVLLDVFKSILSNFNMHNTQSRISLFYFNKENNCFHFINRYSDNADYNERHSEKFEKGNNIISKTWAEKVYTENNCPVFCKKETNRIEYDQYASYAYDNYGYSESDIKSLTMKSCRYFGKRISNADQSLGGVVIIESTDANLRMDTKKLLPELEAYEIVLLDNIRLFSSMLTKEMTK